MAEKISVDAALARITAGVGALPPRRMQVTAALSGHMTAGPAYAAADTPRFDCSAMDGYALRSAETNAATRDRPATFRLCGDIPAQDPPPLLPPGSAAPVSTGSPIPTGADAVIVHERCRITDGDLHIFGRIEPGSNVRRRGEDMPQGVVVLPEGARLSPEAIGALLACGVTHLPVRPQPRIMIIPTGSELSDVAASPSGLRYDSNGPMIGAACRELGLEYAVLPPVPDTVEALRAQIFGTPRSGASELVLTTGGVSAGPHDLVRRAVEADAEIIFHGIAMRPGKPLLCARLRDGRLFFGLPGNPVAAMVGFRFFVCAALRRLMGLPDEEARTFPPALEGRAGTTLFLRARQTGRDGEPPKILADQRSHVMRSLLDADCWVRLEKGAAGTTAHAYPKTAHLL